MRVQWVAILVFALGGCAASHTATGCPAEAALGNPCAAIVTTAPDGVCRLPDGTLLPFLDAEVLPSRCAESVEGEGMDLVVIHCQAGPRGRRAIACDGGPASGPVSFSTTFGSTEGVVFNPGPGSCALHPVFEEVPAAPWEDATERTTQICVEGSPWCGIPLIFDVLLDGFDPCNGSSFAQRCEARLRGSEIVVAVFEAEADPVVCQTAVGERAARCVVPPLDAGEYDVVTEGGRLLTTVNLADAPAEGLERRCQPVEGG